jgi:hypothetical protein
MILGDHMQKKERKKTHSIGLGHQHGLPLNYTSILSCRLDWDINTTRLCTQPMTEETETKRQLHQQAALKQVSNHWSEAHR